VDCIDPWRLFLRRRARLCFTGTRRLTRTPHRPEQKGTFLLCLDTRRTGQESVAIPIGTEYNCIGPV